MTDERPPSDRTETWVVDVRPTCSKCERLAIVYDDRGTAFCARHATIFVTDWKTPGTDRPGS